MEKRCPYCAAALPREARFCPCCGKSLISRKRVHPPRPRLKKCLWALLALLCGALLLCCSRMPRPKIETALALEETAAPETVPTEPTLPAPTKPSRRTRPRIEKTHETRNGMEIEYTMANFLTRRLVEKSPNGFTMETLLRRDGTRVSVYTVFDGKTGFDYIEFHPNGEKSVYIQYRPNCPVETRTFDETGTETGKERTPVEDPFAWIEERRKTLHRLLKEEYPDESKTAE